MQKAAISQVLVPTLLEQIFERFYHSSQTDQEVTENLLLDLHKILGKRLVTAALNILDHQTIIIYRNNPKTIEVAEILGTLSSLRIERVFLQINFCTCKYFQEKVLLKQSACSAPYTCEHVLAVRLAIDLKHKRLEFKEVPTQKLDSILNNFLPPSPEEV